MGSGACMIVLLLAADGGMIEFIEEQSDQMHTCPTYPIRCDDR